MVRKHMTAAFVAAVAMTGTSLLVAPPAQAAARPAAKPVAQVAAAASPAAQALAARPVSGAVKAVRLDRRCLRGRVICASKTDRKVYWVVNGRIRMVLDARFGGTRTPTREGRFRVYRKSRNHVSSLYHTPMPFALFFSRGQAVHYSPDFARRGYNGRSHGCVNTRNRTKMRALFNAVRTGDRVVVYRRR